MTRNEIDQKVYRSSSKHYCLLSCQHYLKIYNIGPIGAKVRLHALAQRIRQWTVSRLLYCTKEDTGFRWSTLSTMLYFMINFIISGHMIINDKPFFNCFIINPSCGNIITHVYFCIAITASVSVILSFYCNSRIIYFNCV